MKIIDVLRLFNLNATIYFLTYINGESFESPAYSVKDITEHGYYIKISHKSIDISGINVLNISSSYSDYFTITIDGDMLSKKINEGNKNEKL